MPDWHGVVLSAGGEPNGCCVLLDEGILITAAHVIRTALGRPEGWREFWSTAEMEMLGLEVRFPNFDAGCDRTYSTRLLPAPWLTDDPNLADGTGGDEPDAYDLCFLQFDGEKPSAAAAQLKTPVSLKRNPVGGDERVPVVRGPQLAAGPSSIRKLRPRGSGFKLIELEVLEGEKKVESGYSGGGLALDEKAASIAGIVVVRAGERVYAIPSSHIEYVASTASKQHHGRCSLPELHRSDELADLLGDKYGKLRTWADSRLEKAEISGISLPVVAKDLKALTTANLSKLAAIHDFSRDLTDTALGGRELYSPGKLADRIRKGTKASILLQAPAGTGKSTYLSQLVYELIDNGVFPALLEFQHLTDMPDEIEAYAEGLIDRVAVPGSGATELEKTINELKKATGENWFGCVIADGFNEISTEILKARRASRNDLLAHTFKFAEKFAGTRLIIADRITEIEPNNDFQLFTLMPVDYETIRTSTKSHFDSRSFSDLEDKEKRFARLLSVPFYLAQYRTILNHQREERGFSSRASLVDHALRVALTSFLERRVEDAPGPESIKLAIHQAFPALAEMAFAAYEQHSSTNFTTEQVQELRKILVQRLEKLGADNSLAENTMKAIDSELLRSHDNDSTGDQLYRFNHQIFHDFFAGYQLTCINRSQIKDGFDIATLQRLSFDAVALGAGLLEKGVSAESLYDTSSFIAEIYDWTWPAAMEAVNELGDFEDPDVEQIRFVLTAMAAEKLFDRFQHSHDTAHKNLEDIQNGGWPFGIDLSEFMNAAGSIHSMIEAISKHRKPKTNRAFAKMSSSTNFSDDVGRFFRIFFGEREDDELIEDMLETSALAGWPAVSVYRRQVRSVSSVKKLLEALHILRRTSDKSNRKPATAKWRLVYALGALPVLLGSGKHGSKKLLAMIPALLLEICNDEGEHPDVRSGAVRSVMEIASYARSEDEARTIINQLLKFIDAGIRPGSDKETPHASKQRQVEAKTALGPILPAPKRPMVRGEGPSWWSQVLRDVANRVDSAIGRLPDDDRDTWSDHVSRLRR